MSPPTRGRSSIRPRLGSISLPKYPRAGQRLAIPHARSSFHTPAFPAFPIAAGALHLPLACVTLRQAIRTRLATGQSGRRSGHHEMYRVMWDLGRASRRRSRRPSRTKGTRPQVTNVRHAGLLSRQIWHSLPIPIRTQGIASLLFSPRWRPGCIARRSTIASRRRNRCR